MATNPIQMYLYIMMVACVFKLRKDYPLAERKAAQLPTCWMRTSA